MSFEFATAGRILFGPGRFQELGTCSAPLGKRIFLVCGSGGRYSEEARCLLSSFEYVSPPFLINGEPTVERVTEGVEEARRIRADLVIGLGGGSVLDAGKAVAILLTNPGEPLDYLEVVGRGKSFSFPSAPFIAIPTTAGTGSEVTRNAVLTSVAHRVKASLRSHSMLPAVALVDPELTYRLPPDITAATGMDALAQILEPLVSLKSQPLTDALCWEALPRIIRSLRQVYRNGDDRDGRQDLCFASLCGGMALANAGLGAVHGLAAPLGGMFSAPHGALCARLLAPVMRTNMEALLDRHPYSQTAGKFSRIAAFFSPHSEPSPPQMIVWLEETCDLLQIPRLAHYGVTAGHLPEIAEKAACSGSMKGNPVPLSKQELMLILSQAL